MKQSVLSENEEISSQHEDIDSKLFYFLMRRLKVSERELGSNLGDYEPLKITEYKFEGFPGYGFTDYVPKKRMETKNQNRIRFSEFCRIRCTINLSLKI